MRVTFFEQLTRRQRAPLLVMGLLLLLWFLIPGRAAAHVKWFSQFSFLDEPRSFIEILTPVYLSMIVLSAAVIGGMVFLERWLGDAAWYKQLNRWLGDQKTTSLLIMRIAMAAVMLITWSSNAVLTPELETTLGWITWLEFLIAIGLMFSRTTWLSGIGLLVLYLAAVFEFGIFHMLDYLHYIGIAIFFIVYQAKDARISGLAFPALYATIGFSLIWLGYEKLVYPEWALYLLEQNPQLTLGLPPGFFLQAAAFVELVLGYLLIIGLLDRPLSATITLVFFMTTLIFGKIEVIGHTPIHAALIVFLFNGPGAFYKPPINIHQKLTWRTAFGVVNFVILMAVFGLAYTFSARWQYETAVADLENNPSVIDVSDLAQRPAITAVEAIDGGEAGWLITADVDQWRFTPELAGGPPIPGEGVITVYDNGREVGRMVGPWFDLGILTPGNHTITLILTGNDGTPFANGTELIGAEIEIVAD